MTESKFSSFGPAKFFETASPDGLLKAADTNFRALGLLCQAALRTLFSLDSVSSMKRVCCALFESSLFAAWRVRLFMHFSET